MTLQTLLIVESIIEKYFLVAYPKLIIFVYTYDEIVYNLVTLLNRETTGGVCLKGKIKNQCSSRDVIAFAKISQELIGEFSEIGFNILKDIKKGKFFDSHLSLLTKDLIASIYHDKFDVISCDNDSNSGIIKSRHKDVRIQGSTERSGLRIISFVYIQMTTLIVLPIHVYSKKDKKDLTQNEKNKLKNLLK